MICRMRRHFVEACQCRLRVDINPEGSRIRSQDKANDRFPAQGSTAGVGRKRLPVGGRDAVMSSDTPAGDPQTCVCSAISSASSTSIPKVTHRAPELGVTEQELNGAEVLGPAIDQRRLGPAHRVRAIRRGIKTNFLDLAVDDSRVLAGAQVRRFAEPAGEEVAVRLQSSLLDPSRDQLSGRRRDLELDRALRLLLQHNRTPFHPITVANVANAQA
jgi:hypothetical protein